MSITENVLLSSYSSMKKYQKDFEDFLHKKLTLKVKVWHFLTPPGDLQVFFLAKYLLILYPSIENSTTSIAISYSPPMAAKDVWF